MAADGSAAPRLEPEYLDYHQHVNCFINVYAPTTVYITSTAGLSREAPVEDEMDYEDLSPAGDAAAIHYAKYQEVSSGKRVRVRAWLIGHLERLLRRLSR